MELVIMLSTTVETIQEAQTIANVVKQKLAQYTDIKVSATVTETILQ